MKYLISDYITAPLPLFFILLLFFYLRHFFDCCETSHDLSENISKKTEIKHFPPRMSSWFNVGLLLGHRLRRWPDNKPALQQSHAVSVNNVIIHGIITPPSPAMHREISMMKIYQCATRLLQVFLIRELKRMTNKRHKASNTPGEGEDFKLVCFFSGSRRFCMGKKRELMRETYIYVCCCCF